MPIADFGAKAWAGIMFGIGALPANFYVALCTDEPGTGWDGSVVNTVEPPDAAYQRQVIPKTTGWTLSDEGFVINAVQLGYPTPVVDWGQIAHYAILDDPNLGNLWAYGKFLEAITVPAGYALAIGIASLNINVADQLASITE